jgi:hypothetical protein
MTDDVIVQMAVTPLNYKSKLFLTNIDDLTCDIDEPTNSSQYSTENLNEENPRNRP